MIKLLKAPQRDEEMMFFAPSVFLAGPITDAPDWQEAAAQHIDLASRPEEEFYVFNPRQPKRVTGADFTEEMYYEQVDWELDHLAHAMSGYSCILFWLAAPVAARLAPTRAYAQTTRLELGKYCSYANFSGNRVVVGIQEGFGNERYIRHWLNRECPTVSVVGTLEAACLRAVEHLRNPTAS